MNTSPMEKVVAAVCREWLQSKAAKLDCIMETTAQELAPIVAGQVKTYFAGLIDDTDVSRKADRWRDTLVHVIHRMEFYQAEPDSFSRDSAEQIYLLCKAALGGSDHGT